MEYIFIYFFLAELVIGFSERKNLCLHPPNSHGMNSYATDPKYKKYVSRYCSGKSRFI